MTGFRRNFLFATSALGAILLASNPAAADCTVDAGANTASCSGVSDPLDGASSGLDIVTSGLTVTNDGTLNGGATVVGVFNPDTGGFTFPSNISFNNNGTLLVTSAMVSEFGVNGNGLILTANNTVNNSGTIDALGSGGIGLFLGSGTLNNSGTIAGGAGIQIDGSFGGGSAVTTIVNTGSIEGAGGLAIGVTDSALNLTLGNESNLIGDVIADDAFDNALTLEGSSSTAANLVGFDSLTVASGASWLIDNDLSVTGAAVIGGALDVSGTFSAGSLEILAGGSFSAGNFVGDLTNSGNTFVAGSNNVGTRAITGNFVNTGTLSFDVREDGTSDTLSISGALTLESSSVLDLAADDANWAVERDFTIITADGGVNGTFGTVNINRDFLETDVTYGANTVNLNITRLSDEIQETIVEETTTQIISSSTRVVTGGVSTRVGNAFIASGISVSGGSDSAGGGSGGSSGDGNNPEFDSGLSAGDPAQKIHWGVWGNVALSGFNQGGTVQNGVNITGFSSDTWNFLGGVDAVINKRFVLGVFTGYEDTTTNLRRAAGNSASRGGLIGGYAGYSVTNWMYISGQISRNFMNNEIAENSFGGSLVTGEFDSERTSMSLGVAMSQQIGKVSVRANVDYSYTEEDFEAYTTSNDFDVEVATSKLERLAISADLGYQWTETFSSFANLAFERDLFRTGFGDEAGAFLGGGMRYRKGAFSVELYSGAEMGRQNESNVTGSLNIRYSF